MKTPKTKMLFFLICLFLWALFSQQSRADRPPPAKSYTVKQTAGSVKIDGIINEPAWQEATVIDLPFEWRPGDNIPALVKTQCLLTYSKRKLYIAFRCFDPEPGKIRAHLMDRDNFLTFLQDDHVGVFIDTFNDERRAFDFRVNPLGVQMDGFFNEADMSQDFSWDGIWESVGKISDSGYTVEIAIPFNQLRFHAGSGTQTWGFSFDRSYPRVVHRRLRSHPIDRSAGIFIPQFNKISGFANMQTGSNIELDPTLALNRTDRREDFPAGEMETGSVGVEPGITARWGITPGLMLNTAVNPDFSHVEADAAQLEVNTRFALRYPEKRPFFLEGVDFFKTPLETVFTRTVSDPLWGGKISGKIGRNVLGFVLARDRVNNLLFPSNRGSSDASLEEEVISGVFRFRRDVGKGSTLGALYTGRVSGDYYNHTAGLDAFLRLSRSKSLNLQFIGSRTRYDTQTTALYHQPEGAFQGSVISCNFTHTGRHIGYGFLYEDLSPGFRADYGFIPRVDLRRFMGFFQTISWGKAGGWFDQIVIDLTGDYIKDHQGELTDSSLQLTALYRGTLQTVVQPVFLRRQERYNGVLYDLNQGQFSMEMQPFGSLKYTVYSQFGNAIDYTNSRLSSAVTVIPGLEFKIGKHLNVNLSHIYERLSFASEKVYTANLFQSRLVYNFNIKTFIRVIFQYMDIERAPDLYTLPIDPETRTFFSQFLFSFKINPQTVLFIGYSDNHFGMRGIDLTRTDRTFFLKIGYALVL